MTKTIDTLVPDIFGVLSRGEEHDPSTDLAVKYAQNIGGALASATLARPKGRVTGKLWASDIGKPCDRKTWYEFNMPTVSLELPGNASFKFLYGNILEEAVLYYAEEAGHTVEGQQDRYEWKINDTWTVSGKIDAVIDGVLIDVKSTSSFGYTKYKTSGGITPGIDTFGYIPQLAFYHHQGAGDPKEAPGFLWIDKQNGSLMVDRVSIPNEAALRSKVEAKINAIESVVPPERPYDDEPMGKAGNRKLPTTCSYCDFRTECWKDVGVRTFLYSNGPVHLTKVVREPNVPEATS